MYFSHLFIGEKKNMLILLREIYVKDFFLKNAKDTQPLSTPNPIFGTTWFVNDSWEKFINRKIIKQWFWTLPS